MMAVPSECILIRPECFFCWPYNGTVLQGHQVAGNIESGPQFKREQYGVFRRNAKHAFVKRPVAEAAERHAIPGIIIVAARPGDDVGGIDRAMPIRGQHAYPTKRAAVVVHTDDGPTEALIAAGRLVLFSLGWRFLNPFLDLLNQRLAVLKRLGVDSSLVEQRRMIFGGKVGLDQAGTQGIPRRFHLQQLEEIFIEPCAKRQLVELVERIHLARAPEQIFFTWLGD